MQNVYSIKKLDVNNIDHIEITYEILQKRFAKSHINLNLSQLPTKDEHIALLKSDRYEYYYICSYNDIDFMVIYVIKETCCFGFFFHPLKWRKVVRNYRNNLKEDSKNLSQKHISENMPTGHKMAFISLQRCLNLLTETHPDLLGRLKATVNYNNNLSKQFALVGGFKPVSIEYIYDPE